MQLHEARKADLGHKKKVRVGRGPGSGIGKTSGRGLKGATARSGWTMKATYEGGQMPLFRRLPKRGFTNGPFRETFAVVNVGALGSFTAGSAVGPEELRAAGVVQGGPHAPIKILGDGELTVALNLKADAFSKSALEKIAKAGGKAEWLGGAPKKPAPDFKKLEAEKKAKDAEKGKGKEQKGEGGKPGKAEGGKPKAEDGKPAKPEAAKAPKPEGAKPQGAAAPKAEGAKPPKAATPKAPKPPKAEAPKPAAEGEQKPQQQ
jgi:large subunit ribosomal protein L15